eukprot:COSAG01_NODE_240_length_20656_cov_53.398259_20_plen_111_part_00
MTIGAIMQQQPAAGHACRQLQRNRRRQVFTILTRYYSYIPGTAGGIGFVCLPIFCCLMQNAWRKFQYDCCLSYFSSRSRQENTEILYSTCTCTVHGTWRMAGRPDRQLTH